MNLQTYHIESFGCQMNLSDSERIASQLESLGYVQSDIKNDADIIVINTCCVRESAENRIFGHIGALKQVKLQRPDLVIIVSGCLAQKNQQLILKRAPHVNIVLGTQNIDRVAEILKDYDAKKRIVESGEYENDGLEPIADLKHHSGVSAWVPVMFGCDNYCSYCIVPYVRGRERSRPPETILDEIRSFVAKGGREVTLLGQNVNSYGNNFTENWNFPRLLQQVNAIEGIERVRFMTSHPKDFNDELIEVMVTGKNICQHLHLPVQSGCDEILRRMNRNYTISSYRKHIEKVRTAIPEISITTDIIVGFPGETDEMFEQTLAFMAEIKFDSAFTFLYSRRSGTPAATMEQQVDPILQKLRLQRLMDLQHEISLQSNLSWVGRKVEVLADGPSKNDPAIYSGRTGQNRIVLWPVQPDDKPGVFRIVQIESAQTFVLKGSAVSGRI